MDYIFLVAASLLWLMVEAATAVVMLSPCDAWEFSRLSNAMSALIVGVGGRKAEILALKHESRILGQWSFPVCGSRKIQAGSPWAKQHRV